MFQRTCYLEAVRAALGSAFLLAVALGSGCAGRATALETAHVDGADAAFALALWDAMAPEGNAAISPLVLRDALTLTHIGARGAAARSIERALGARSRAELRGRASPTDSEQLARAVNVWVDPSLGLDARYVAAVDARFGVRPDALDLRGAPAAARETINAWISARTRSKIPALLPADAISVDTRVVLASALAFAGAWARPFDPERTVRGEFETRDGARVETPLMMLEDQLRYGWREDGWGMLELPYEGGRYSLGLILPPPEARARPPGEGLTPALLDALWGGLQEGRALVVLPRFTLAGETVGLRGALTRLGMAPLFEDPRALAGLAAEPLALEELYVSTFVEVDERGTKATAAAAAVVGLRSGPTRVAFTRPFVFALRDGETGALVLLGQVVDPTRGA
ncbi:MAG: hypothetical protein H6713_25025 [Myxococcales bacterium]|nr:hypothetical protein [Myxococcales bacterium]